jgi:hypothetical protein
MSTEQVDPAADQEMSHDSKSKDPWFNNIESSLAVEVIL